MKTLLIQYPATMLGWIAFALFALALEGELCLLSLFFVLVAFMSEARS